MLEAEYRLLRWELLWAAHEDLTGAWEAAWQANTSLAHLDGPTRVRIARRVLLDLLRDGEIFFVDVGDRWPAAKEEPPHLPIEAVEKLLASEGWFRTEPDPMFFFTATSDELPAEIQSERPELPARQHDA